MARKPKQITRFNPPLQQWPAERAVPVVLRILDRMGAYIPTIAVCMAFGIEIPEWVNKLLADELLRAAFDGERPRLEWLPKDLKIFYWQALRYNSVLRCSKKGHPLRGQDPFERAFNAFKIEPFMTPTISGLKTSCDDFQKTLGSNRQLASYIASCIADRITAAPMECQVVPLGGIATNLPTCEAPTVNHRKAGSPKRR